MLGDRYVRGVTRRDPDVDPLSSRLTHRRHEDVVLAARAALELELDPDAIALVPDSAAAQAGGWPLDPKARHRRPGGDACVRLDGIGVPAHTTKMAPSNVTPSSHPQHANTSLVMSVARVVRNDLPRHH